MTVQPRNRMNSSLPPSQPQCLRICPAGKYSHILLVQGRRIQFIIACIMPSCQARSWPLEKLFMTSKKSPAPPQLERKRCLRVTLNPLAEMQINPICCHKVHYTPLTLNRSPSLIPVLLNTSFSTKLRAHPLFSISPAFPGPRTPEPRAQVG